MTLKLLLWSTRMGSRLRYSTPHLMFGVVLFCFARYDVFGIIQIFWWCSLWICFDSSTQRFLYIIEELFHHHVFFSTPILSLHSHALSHPCRLPSIFLLSSPPPPPSPLEIESFAVDINMDIWGQCYKTEKERIHSIIWLLYRDTHWGAH